ncbi:MAG: lipoprotein, partial [Solobacterium sp.]|nr:lipoprotein [Solobacterium sp.]
MKKMVLLILAALVLTGCTVKEKDTEITVFNNPVSAVYTGKVKRKVPDGEGTAIMDTDVSVEGLFENGTLVSGEASNVPYSITYNTQMISGTYTGEVADQLPSGSGDFTSDMFSYSGTWIDGEPDGKGTVSAENFRIDTLSDALEGSYSGEVNQGLAEGYGTFTYTDGSHEIEISGNFTGNKFDGLMVKTIRYPETVKSFPVYYQKGWPLHTAVAMIAYLEGMRNESYCLSEAQSSFISEHSALFEGTRKDIPGEYDSAFDYESFSEEDEPSLVLIRNAVIRS